MNLDTKNLPPEVTAYIRLLEQKNQQLEKQLVKMHKRMCTCRLSCAFIWSKISSASPYPAWLRSLFIG